MGNKFMVHTAGRSWRPSSRHTLAYCREQWYHCRGWVGLNEQHQPYPFKLCHHLWAETAVKALLVRPFSVADMWALVTVCRLRRRSLCQCGHDLCWPHGMQHCYRHLQCVSLHVWLTPFSSPQSCSSWQTANLQPNSRQAKPTSAHTDGQLQQRLKASLRKSHHRLRLTQACTGQKWECDSLRPELCPSACIHKQLQNSLSSSLTLFMAHLQHLEIALHLHCFKHTLYLYHVLRHTFHQTVLLPLVEIKWFFDQLSSF